MMHPNGSGLNPSVSLSDLVSLGHKIRGRGGSSDLLYDADASMSHGTSCRASARSIDGVSSLGRDLRERERDLLTPRHRAIAKSSFGVRTSLAALFNSEKCRVGVMNSDFSEVDIEAAVSSMTSLSAASVAPSPVGPCLRVRELTHEEEEVKNRLSVLVVDDSASTRKILCKVLVAHGYSAYSANNGQCCLDLFDEAESKGDGECPSIFDIIIMDDSMPILTGTETVSILRSRGYKGVICGVTGNTSIEDVRHFLACGASVVLPKPLDFSLFEREIRGITEK